MDISRIKQLAKDITINSMPELLKLIPVVGVALSDGAKVVIGGINKENTENSDRAAQEQAAELKKKAAEMGMTDEQLMDKLKEELKNQIEDNNKQLVYCSGIIVYTSDDYRISADMKNALMVILNPDDDYFDEEDEDEEVKRLRSAESNMKGFLCEYQVADNCEINEGSIGITFEWSVGVEYDGYMDFEYNQEMIAAIKQFISDLNYITANISGESVSGPYFDLYVPF